MNKKIKNNKEFNLDKATFKETFLQSWKFTLYVLPFVLEVAFLFKSAEKIIDLILK